MWAPVVIVFVSSISQPMLSSWICNGSTGAGGQVAASGMMGGLFRVVADSWAGNSGCGCGKSLVSCTFLDWATP